MKRMNEVFELPLSQDSAMLNDASGDWRGGFNLRDEAAHAATAINNVDKLADALEESLAMLFMAHNLHYGTGIDDTVIARIRAVLDGYRGEK